VRRAAALVVVLGLGAFALAASGFGGSGGSGYRVDALFDNASNLIPGQDVKIAGAKVGSVVGVRLTHDRLARVQMQVDGRFAPFRSDADCTIQPQSLIGEKFVQCTPGTPRGSELRRGGGQAATVPLANTHAPVDIDLVLSALRLPYRQRLSVIVNALGTGLAGRAGDLNAAIRRANPALAEANRVLRIVDRDRGRLGALVSESDTIIAQLAARRGRVADFIDRAAAVSARTADQRGNLADAVHRLPALLGEARPTLARLRELGAAGTPVAANLRVAAPQVDRLVRDVGPAADAGRPALAHLGGAAAIGARALRAGRPVVGHLRTFARAARPTGALVAELFTSMKARGVVEGLQDFVYFGSAATSRFDRVSHIFPAHLITSECQTYATVTLPQCDAHFAGGRTRAASRRTGLERAAAPQIPGLSARPPAASAPTPAPAQPGPAPSSAAPAAPQLPSIPQPPAPDQVGRTVRDLLGYLLK
jgi:virulence factor Mce-like protein